MASPTPKPPRPLPVLFLVPNLITGGAERQLAALVTRMNRERFLPVVVCQKEGGPFYDPIVEAGLPAYRLGVRGKWDPRFAWRLARVCRRHGIRAFVIRGFSTGVIGRLVARALRIRPVVMAEHSTGRIDPDPKKRPLERLFAPWADGVIAVAKGQVPFLIEDKGYAPDRIRVIYNGIDLADWTPAEPDPAILAEFGIPADAPVAGILAMLRPEKDHATFLEAAHRVLQRLPGAHFLIVGDGHARPDLERQARDLGVDHAVHFTGQRADIPQLLTIFDVSVLCSTIIETFPMSFLEAMAMERPLIGTRVGGVPEMIEEGGNGYVVPLSDPEALAEALVRVIADRQTARRMGRRSREMVAERFTIQRMVRDTEDYLDSLVRN